MLHCYLIGPRGIDETPARVHEPRPCFCNIAVLESLSGTIDSARRCAPYREPPSRDTDDPYRRFRDWPHTRATMPVQREVDMTTARTEAFVVTRIPSSTGEWLDVHVGVNGDLCLTTSGYVEFDGRELISALEALLQG